MWRVGAGSLPSGTAWRGEDTDQQQLAWSPDLGAQGIARLDAGPLQRLHAEP